MSCRGSDWTRGPNHLRPHRSRRLRWPSCTSRFVSQALAPDAFKGKIGALLHVANARRFPIGVAEIKLAQIALQVRFRDVLVNAIDAVLEDRKVAFNGVGMDRAANVFLSGVLHGEVAREIPADPGVDRSLIGHEPAIAMDVPRDDGPQHLGGNVRNMEAANQPLRSTSAMLGRGRLIGAAV